MLLEDALVQELLRQIVAGLIKDPVLQQDLEQECLIHLWRLKREKPGQTQNRCLQSRGFHLGRCLAAGRSLDSPNRTGPDNRSSI